MPSFVAHVWPSESSARLSFRKSAIETGDDGHAPARDAKRRNEVACNASCKDDFGCHDVDMKDLSKSLSKPKRQLVLASGSPRRKMLLEAIGLQPIVRPVDVDETPEDGEAPDVLARRLALKKARAARIRRDDVVLSADTMVAFDGHLLGKPTDDDDAVRMLRMLSGQEHEVWTAFCVRDEEREEVHAVCTFVKFRALHDDEIRAYVASGEPRDKAGAYGIQGGGGALVEEARGSYPNVVGLPVKEVLTTLKAFGVYHGSAA